MAELQSLAHLIEELRRDQRRGWQAGNKTPVEDFLRQYPEIAADAEATLELVYNEVVVRQDCELHTWRNIEALRNSWPVEFCLRSSA